jgi:CMP-N-acetylneuraminic acid synthetase
MKISIVVPAKGNSERLKNKNLSVINGKSLIRICCEKLLLCKNIDNIYLDTDDDRIVAQVDDLKRINIIRRPIELANNSITANDLMAYHLHMIEPCDVLLQTFVTSPLISAKTIDSCIEKFTESDTHDSFFTVVTVQEYFWNNAGPLNFNLDSLPNSFELESKMMETHGLYGILTNTLLNKKRRVGDKPMLIEIDKIEALDINGAEDLKIIKKLMQHD